MVEVEDCCEKLAAGKSIVSARVSVLKRRMGGIPISFLVEASGSAGASLLWLRPTNKYYFVNPLHLSVFPSYLFSQRREDAKKIQTQNLYKNIPKIIDNVPNTINICQNILDRLNTYLSSIFSKYLSYKKYISN